MSLYITQRREASGAAGEFSPRLVRGGNSVASPGPLASLLTVLSASRTDGIFICPLFWVAFYVNVNFRLLAL